MSRANSLSFKFQEKKRHKHTELHKIKKAYINMCVFFNLPNQELISFARLNTIK